MINEKIQRILIYNKSFFKHIYGNNYCIFDDVSSNFTKIFSPVKEDIDILYIDWALLRSRRNPGQTAPA